MRDNNILAYENREQAAIIANDEYFRSLDFINVWDTNQNIQSLALEELCSEMPHRLATHCHPERDYTEFLTIIHAIKQHQSSFDNSSQATQSLQIASIIAHDRLTKLVMFSRRPAIPLNHPNGAPQRFIATLGE